MAYNARERPRAVLAGWAASDPLTGAVVGQVGSVSPLAIDKQPLHERDVVFVWQQVLNSGGRRDGIDAQPNLRVLQFGGHPVSIWAPVSEEYVEPGPSLATALGEELDVAEQCPSSLRKLVKDTLLPLLAARGASQTVIAEHWDDPWAATTFIPLVVNSNKDALAAIYSHPDIAEVWWLPIAEGDEATFDFASWVHAALDAWHEADPERFPGPPDWARSKDWMTHHELQLQEAVEEARLELKQQQEVLQAAVDARISDLVAAQDRHDADERILLTGQSEELARAVKAVLSRLGFTVEDMDEVRTGQKAEDLRVCDPETSWVALAEVKGYRASGGKPGDIIKIARFVGFFERDTGSLPDATWYILNQYADTPPSRRRTAMSHHPEDVDGFAENLRGVVIDTRDLFLLDRRVAAGELSQADARTLLRSAKRLFSLKEADQHGHAAGSSGLH